MLIWKVCNKEELWAKIRNIRIFMVDDKVKDLFYWWWWWWWWWRWWWRWWHWENIAPGASKAAAGVQDMLRILQGKKSDASFETSPWHNNHHHHYHQLHNHNHYEGVKRPHCNHHSEMFREGFTKKNHVKSLVFCQTGGWGGKICFTHQWFILKKEN